MLSRGTKDPHNTSQSSKTAKSSQNRHYKHGAEQSEQNHFSFLLEVPAEILTGITSHLDPPSLQSLAQVDSYLHRHVEDDNTWRRAFVSQYLNIGPEGNLQDNSRCLMLKRSEPSWRKEYVVRYKLRRRWERSRNVTTSHNPLNSPISNMHLMSSMSSDSLLSSSLKYGIVARSLPLTGRILSGYLDASGSTTGRGIGNPNAEFTPNVSSCAIATDGGTARILWGYRNGEVAMMVANKTMERRPTSDFKRCSALDEHQASVCDTFWSDAQSRWVAVTGASDGHVKLWDSKTAACLWSSKKNFNAHGLVPEPCVKVAAAFPLGCIVGVMQSGEIHIWLGFDTEADLVIPSNEIILPCPLSPSRSNAPPRVLALFLDVIASPPSILVAFQEDVRFYRIDVNHHKCSAQVSAFGDSSFATITSLMPSFSSHSDESNFIITGDTLGCVNIYNWNSPTSTTSILPTRKFEAHADGSAITAIAWNEVTLLTGSILGTTSVFDGLTFQRLRMFQSPVPRLRNSPFDAEREAVRHILLGSEKDVVFMGVGDRVMSWKAGPVAKGNSGGVRGRNVHGVSRKKIQSGPAKWSQQIEMKQAINESRALINQDRKDRKHIHQVYGPEKEQMAHLNNLGLSEVEAVEYVLMLSREEAASSNAASSSRKALDGLTDPETSVAIEEGVFEGDFEDSRSINDTSNTPMVPAVTRSLSASSSSSSLSSRTGLTMTPSGRPVPRATPSPSNNKVQVSPPYVEEPLQAGLGETCALPSPIPMVVASDPLHFPPINTNRHPASPNISESSRKNVSPREASASPRHRRTGSTAIGSPASHKGRSAWSAPLTKSSPEKSPASSSSSRASGVMPRNSPPHLHRTPASIESRGVRPDEDEDLRFALELSLIEARSRGEDA